MENKHDKDMRFLQQSVQKSLEIIHAKNKELSIYQLQVQEQNLLSEQQKALIFELKSKLAEILDKNARNQSTQDLKYNQCLIQGQKQMQQLKQRLLSSKQNELNLTIDLKRTRGENGDLKRQVGILQQVVLKQEQLLKMK
ncbi:Hypothetical_protein [Hexamita inflata]|uniref:Hypothetical_protein n=1 Tax=Hexamita inflata TaxID=28002 RepID=A0AA86QV79_9EUKA|nr:Hypothetical protein HINF_LOCUS52865 [Hexamita inflata]